MNEIFRRLFGRELKGQRTEEINEAAMQKASELVMEYKLDTKPKKVDENIISTYKFMEDRKEIDSRVILIVSEEEFGRVFNGLKLQKMYWNIEQGNDNSGGYGQRRIWIITEKVRIVTESYLIKLPFWTEEIDESYRKQKEEKSTWMYYDAINGGEAERFAVNWEINGKND